MRVVVVGSDGLIGKALGGRLRQRAHAVVGTTRRAEQADGDERLFLDLAATTLPPLPAADIAVFCAAMATFADCRNFPELARRVNVTAPAALAKAFADRGGRVLMLSSSVVFDCQSPHVAGDQPTAPRSAYGVMKADVEADILGLHGTVLRLTKVITAQSGRLARWVEAFEQGRTVRAFEDHRFCPITLEQTLAAITAVVEQAESGVFQLSGADDISYADAARHIAERLGVPESRVEGTLAVENGIPESEVTPFTSLDTGRLGALTGYVPLPARAVIDEVFAAAFAGARVP